MSLLGDIWDAGTSIAGDIFELGWNVATLDFAGVGDNLDSIINTFAEWILFDVLGIELPEDINGVLVTKSSATEPLPIIYGKRRVGGTIVHIHTSGTDNNSLWMVLALCEGPVNSLDDVYIDDVISTDARFTGKLEMWKYTGTPTQIANANLSAVDLNWTTNHRLQGVAYIVLRFLWDQEVYGNLPQVTVDVRGKLVYNLNTLVTEYSSNPAYCIYDYLTNTTYGKGLNPSVLNTQTFIDSANYNDESIVTYSGGPSHSRHSCDAVVNPSTRILDNIKHLLSSSRAALPYSAGKFSLISERNLASTFDFTEDNIIGGWSFKSIDINNRFNRVKATYPDPDYGYQSNYIIVESATFRAQDNGKLMEASITLPYTTNVYRALDSASVALRKSRQGIAVNFAASLEAANVIVGDIVTITHSTPGWSVKLFRVLSVFLTSNGVLKFSLEEFEPTVYDLSLPNEYPTPPDTTHPNYRLAISPTSVQAVSDSSTLLLMSDGTVIPRIKLSWVAPLDAFIDGYIIEYKATTSSIWLTSPKVSSLSTTEHFISDVVQTSLYDVRIRAVNIAGFSSVFTVVNNIAIVGKEAPPADVTGFVAVLQDYQIRLVWNRVPDADVLEYELREGTVWSTSTFVALVRSTEYLHPMATSGTRYFMIKAVDTSRNYSLNATSTNIVINAPTQPIISSAFSGENFNFSWSASTASFPIAEYEVRIGATWATAAFVAAVRSTAYSYRVDFLTAKFWVAAVDAIGNYSTPSSVDAVITILSQPSLTADIIDNNVLLRWSNSIGSLPVRFYEIRKGAIFSSAEVLQTVSGTFATFFESQAGDYVYWVVPVDTALNYGTEVNISTTVNQPPDYILNVNWISDLDGTKINCADMVNGDLLVPVNTTETYQQHFVNNSYTSPQDQVNAGFPYLMEPSTVSASYEEEFNYGTVLPATLISITPSTVAVTGSVSMVITISTKLLVGDPWTDYVGTNLVFETNFQYVKVKLDFTAAGGDDLLRITGLNVKLDSKIISDSGSGSAVSTDVGGTTVTFNKTFTDVDSIVLSPLGTTPVTAVYDFLDVPNPTTFSVYLFNNAGTRVSGGFSWSAKGF